MKANNVTRLLDQRKIAYTAFELPAEKLGAQEAAAFLGVPAAEVYKTIVVVRTRQGKPLLAVVPGSREVDLKALAAAVDEKKLELPSEREAERLTGLQAGGISPLALLNRGFQVIIDQSAGGLASFYISAGQRGLNVRLSPQDVAKLCNARFAPISRLTP